MRWWRSSQSHRGADPLPTAICTARIVRVSQPGSCRQSTSIPVLCLPVPVFLRPGLCFQRAQPAHSTHGEVLFTRLSSDRPLFQRCTGSLRIHRLVPLLAHSPLVSCITIHNTDIKNVNIDDATRLV
ncbi:unnamed protein product [Scytosiphon promiscuus]